MFHLRFGLSDHLKTLLDFVFGSRRRVKKVRIFRAWFSQARLEKSQSLHRTMNSILQLVDSLRPDELIWLHAYMTGRVHALMPATHLQMSGGSMGTQSSVPEAAASVSSERSTPPRGVKNRFLRCSSLL